MPLDCGCRDPWPCRCHERCPCCGQEPPPSEVQLDGWRDAILHLADHGLVAIVPAWVRRALRERYAA
jgi:hypothetical protein